MNGIFEHQIGNRRVVQISHEQVPSWLVEGKGFATLTISAHGERPFLEISLQEVNLEKRGASKRTYVVLSEDEARFLHGWLCERFGGSDV